MVNTHELNQEKGKKWGHLRMSFQVYYLGVKTYPIKRRRNVKKIKSYFAKKKKRLLFLIKIMNLLPY